MTLHGYGESDPRVVPATGPAYVKHRDDGWPFCPGCGEDELWSAEMPATVESIVECLRCNWEPGYGIRVRG